MSVLFFFNTPRGEWKHGEEEKETLEEANKAHKARFLALGDVFKGAPKKM